MQPPFPDPSVTIAGRHFWTKGQKRRWLAACAGLPEPAPRSDDEELLTSRQLRRELGDVSAMWIWRRRRKALARTP
jgi:hypothetical protein